MDAISLREARKRRRLTQQQLAALAGVPQSQISALELGKRQDISLSAAKQLARALRMNIMRVEFTAALEATD